jgi:hypothetical protein
MQENAAAGLTSNTATKRKGLFGTSIAAKPLVVPNSDNVRNFLKNEGPVPFFENPITGNIDTYWIEEVQALASAAALYGEQNFDAVQKALKEAVVMTAQRSLSSRIGGALGFDKLIPASIRSQYPMSRLRAIRIQRLLWAMSLVRRRYYELLPADFFADNQKSKKNSQAIFGLVLSTLKDIALMTDTKAVFRGTFEWALTKGDAQEVTVAGQYFGTSKFNTVFVHKEFGEAMMTLYEIGKMRNDVNLDRNMIQISINFLGTNSKSALSQAASALLAVLNPINVAEGVGKAVTGLGQLSGSAMKRLVNLFSDKQEEEAPVTQPEVIEPENGPRPITPQAAVYFTKLFDETPIAVSMQNYDEIMGWLLYRSNETLNLLTSRADSSKA